LFLLGKKGVDKLDNPCYTVSINNKGANYMNYAVHTQHLENYGAHQESGKFSDGQNYWKMKGGDTYIVSGLDRVQDAVAFVMAAFSDNGLGFKEFPVEWETEVEWLAGMADDDEDYREFKKECAYRVSPQTGTKRTAYQERKAA
jgi:hypothetical protein